MSDSPDETAARPPATLDGADASAAASRPDAAATADNPSDQAPPPRCRWRIPRLVVSLLVTFLLAVLLTLGLVLGTQTGLRAALALAEDLLPGVLSIEHADGRVLRRLHLAGIKLDLPSLHLKIGRFDLDWSPLQAVSGTLPIAQLAVRDIDLVLVPTPEQATEPLVLPRIVLPVRLEVGEVLVERLRVFEPDVETPTLVLDRATLTASLQGSAFDLTRLTVDLSKPALGVRTQGHARLVDQYPLDLTLDWTLTMDPAVRLEGEGHLSGDLARLDLSHRLTGSVDSKVEIQIQDLLEQPAWEGLVTLARVDLPDFRADLPQVEIGARLRTHGNLSDAALTGRLDAKANTLPQYGQWQADLDLLWKGRVLDIHRLELTEQLSKAVFRANGEVDLNPAPGRFAIEGIWEQLRWPLSGERVAESAQGRLKASGTFDAFEYSLTTEAQGPGFPPTGLALTGRGTPQSTRIETLRLEALAGRIEGQASLAWAPKVTWEAGLTILGIDPGTYAPAWPGHIDGRLTSQGSLEADGPHLMADLAEIKGVLRGYPIAASGQFAMLGPQIRLQAFKAASGSSEARIEGTLDQALNLAFALNSPDLATLWPTAKGSLRTQGHTSGPLKTPRLQLDLAAKDVEFDGQGVASLSGTADLDLGSGGRLSMRLDGTELLAGGQLWNRLAVRGAGTQFDHRLDVSLVGSQLSIGLAASGSRPAAGGYEGQLAKLAIQSANFGVWGLERPSPFRLAPPAIAAGPLCLRERGGSGGCVQFDQTQTSQWNASLDLKPLDFALLDGLLPENLVAKGGARVAGRFAAAGGRFTGGATAEIPQGSIRVLMGKGREEVLDFSSTRLTLDADPQGLSARLGLPLKDLGGIEGDIALPGWRLAEPARPNQPVRGRVQAKVEDLRRIANLIPDLTAVTGAIDADFRIGGTLSAPGLQGGAGARGVGFVVPLIGLSFKDLNLRVDAPALDRVTLQGTADVGGGRLELSGDGRFGAGGLAARVQAAGQRLKVADTKAYFVLVSPTVDLEATARGARLQGEIRVPEARIRPRSLPAGTISPSSDVVMIDQQQAPPYPVEIAMRLVLGDQVTIDAFGVRGRLAGQLDITQSPGRDMLGDGQLQIIDGIYRLSGFGIAADLGPALTINQGRLIFAKTPLANPGLLIQAEREGGDTSAGVRVVGTLRNPKLAFFSESDPDMTQAEITKYLMTGIAPSANDQAANAGLAVGTYITPKTYMEYESGLGNEPNKVRLRYDLNNRIELQTESGANQGADIFFKFEN